MNIEVVKQYIVFIIGGALGALVKWVCCFFLTSLLGVYYMAGLLGAELINVLVNYTWHRTVTFRVRGGDLRQFFNFLLLSGMTVMLSMALVFFVKECILDTICHITVKGIELNYLAAIAGVTLIVSFINYLVSRKWIFVQNAASAGFPEDLLRDDPISGDASRLK
jgi:putative flippase GtrA